jgi:hypothetical protein
LKREVSLQSYPSHEPVGAVPSVDLTHGTPSAASTAAASASSNHQEVESLLSLAMAQSDLTTTILQQRYEILRQLHSYWRTGDLQAISETLLPLLNSIPQADSSAASAVSSGVSSSSQSTLSLVLVLSDFLTSIDLHSSTVTLSTCPIFLNLFLKYLQEMSHRPSSSSSAISFPSQSPSPSLHSSPPLSSPPLSSVMISILRSTLTLYQIFSRIIHETRAIGSCSHGNIDMAREERLERCNQCYQLFVRLRDSSDLLRERYRKNRDVIDEFQRGLRDLDEY